MDQIGKFSLVDVFVIQFISATLYTTIDVGLEARLRRAVPEDRLDVLNVVLRTNQDVGFMSFVLATVGSLVLGHICLHWHEQDPAARLEHVAAVRSMPGRARLPDGFFT